MKVLLFGGSGMIGQGTLLECLKRDDVTEVVSFGRSPLPQTHPKLKQVSRADLHDWRGAEAELRGVDAVLWCLGVSSGGLSEADYTRITHTLTMDAAKAIHAQSPGATFCFISGASSDVNGKAMWARVKGKTEQDLQQVGFKAVYCFRPGYIQPMDGIESKTPSYKWLYVFTKPLYPLFKGQTKYVTSTRQLGHAMVQVAKQGFPKTVLESADINSVS